MSFYLGMKFQGALGCGRGVSDREKFQKEHGREVSASVRAVSPGHSPSEKVGSGSGGESCSILYLKMTGECCPSMKNRGRRNPFQPTFQSRVSSLGARVFYDQIPGESHPSRPVFLPEFRPCRRLRSGRNNSPFASPLPLQKRGQIQASPSRRSQLFQNDKRNIMKNSDAKLQTPHYRSNAATRTTLDRAPRQSMRLT